jgi:spore germination protein KC
MNLKKRTMLFVVICFSVFLSGCWDSEELQKLDIISAIGIDMGSDKEENRIRATVQIVNPPQIAGGQQGGKFQSSPVTAYTAEGSTLLEALRKITSKASGELFFPHVQLFVIGEEMAKEGIQDLFDLIERDSQFRVLFPVVISRGYKAEELLKVMTPLESIPASKIKNALDSSKEGWGEYASTRADQVIDGLSKGSLWITGIKINGEQKMGNTPENVQQIYPPAKLEIGGLALFKNGKLKKWLDGDEARGTNWINNEVNRTVVNLDCLKKKNSIAVEVSRSNTDIKVAIKNQKPIISIEVHTEGDISEAVCPIDLSSKNTIEDLQKEMQKEIKEEVLLAVKAAQKEKSDIFNLGQYVNIEDKKVWKQIENRWEDEIFPETEFNVTIKAFIRRTGMRTKSYLKSK